MYVVRSGSMMQIRDSFACAGDLVCRDLPWMEKFWQEVWEGLLSINTIRKQRGSLAGVLSGRCFIELELRRF